MLWYLAVKAAMLCDVGAVKAFATLVERPMNGRGLVRAK